MTEENPFQKALEHFDDGRGWIQGASYRTVIKDPTIPYPEAFHIPDSERYQEQWCSSGVLCHSLMPLGIVQTENALDVLATVIKEQYPSTYLSDALLVIPRWNDEPSRTFAEVEAVFEKARLRWEEEYGK